MFTVSSQRDSIYYIKSSVNIAKFIIIVFLFIMFIPKYILDSYLIYNLVFLVFFSFIIILYKYYSVKVMCRILWQNYTYLKYR